MSGTEMAISKSNQSTAAATPSESMSSIASPLDLQDIAVGLGEVLAKEVSLQQVDKSFECFDDVIVKYNYRNKNAAAAFSENIS